MTKKERQHWTALANEYAYCAGVYEASRRRHERQIVRYGDRYISSKVRARRCYHYAIEYFLEAKAIDRKLGNSKASSSKQVSIPTVEELAPYYNDVEEDTHLLF